MARSSGFIRRYIVEVSTYIAAVVVLNTGALTLLNGAAASFGAASQPVDSSLSADGRFLYQLLRGTGAVAALRVGNDGSLTSLGTITGSLPVADGASGLAAY